MREFFTNFKNVLTSLFNMQIEDTPLVLRSILSQVLRFGLLSLCILSAVLLIQLIISIADKNSRGKKFKNPIFIGITLLITAGVSIFAFVPISAAPKNTVTSGAFQDILFTEEAFAQQSTDGAAAESGEQAATDENISTDGENVETPEGTGDESDDSETETEVKSFVISSHAELENDYTAEIVALLENTKCTRTLSRGLPEEDGQNIMLRLENGDVWQVRLNAASGYAFIEEEVDFIYEINDYEAFHSELSRILQA